jgi:outer membrane protein assembly factor BamB
MTRWLALLVFLSLSAGMAPAAETLKVRWHIMLGDVADTSPIVVGNRLYETTRGGTTVAVDIANGHILWRFTTHGPGITTSVPAYDASTHSLYAPGLDGYVHKLDPSNGRELRSLGFPEQITLAPQTEKNASPLKIANGFLYAQTSGYIGDPTPYVGHVVAIRLSDGARTVFNTLCSSRHELMQPQNCDAQRSGMWSRAGVVVDSEPSMDGRIYVATGNGPFNASAGNYGDSILSLSRDASRLMGYVTPSDYGELESSDLDVGSSSPALLPRQDDSATPLLAVQGGKDAVLRLFDRTHMAGIGSWLQTLSLDDELLSAPAVWTNRSGETLVILGLSGGVRAYRLTTEHGRSRLVEAWHVDVSTGREGSTPAVSGGVVYLATPGRLLALDAQNGNALAHSDALGPIHWESPAVDADTVYCSDQSGALTAFGMAVR